MPNTDKQGGNIPVVRRGVTTRLILGKVDFRKDIEAQPKDCNEEHDNQVFRNYKESFYQQAYNHHSHLSSLSSTCFSAASYSTSVTMPKVFISNTFNGVINCGAPPSNHFIDVSFTQDFWTRPLIPFRWSV